MNPFAHSSAAERYRAGRFYFHPLVVEKIVGRWSELLPFSKALDIGCGTGMSTRALLPIAREIIGTDLSSEMLAQAEADLRVRYLQAPAEAQPFPEASVDLITVCKAFHWFDQPRFLLEAARILKPQGKMAIYGHGFPGIMLNDEGFLEWFKTEFMTRYPNPSRPSTDQGRIVIEQSVFGLEEERFLHTLWLELEQLTEHLLTWSNVIQKVEQGQESIADIRTWLNTQMQPFFLGMQRELQFQGHIWFCQIL